MGLTLTFDEINIMTLGEEVRFCNSLLCNWNGLVRMVFLVSRKVMKNDDGMMKRK